MENNIKIVKKEIDKLNGLIPELMKKVGKKYTDGFSDVVVSVFDVNAKGSDSMAVISEKKIADSEGKPEHDFTRPDSTPNTPEEQALANTLVEEIVSATKTVKIDFSSAGTLNNITLPEEVNQFVYLTGNCENGATITSNSTKGISLTNTSEEPIDIIIDCKGLVYLVGKFNNVYTTQPKLGSSSGGDAVYYGTITFDETITGNVEVTGDFQNGAMVQTMTTGNVSVTNKNEATSIEIYTPKGEITANGKYNELTVTVSENTLYLKENCHINKLIMIKGNVKYYGINQEDFVDEYEGEGSIGPMSWNIPEDGAITKLSSSAGVYNINEDIDAPGKAIGFGLFANGKYLYNLNGHNVDLGNKNYSLFVRGTATINFEGNGSFVNTANGYGVWVSSTGATVNIYDGYFEGTTHTLYAENGEINVYGGIYKLTDAATAERDVNGNLKFLLNCLDASYTSGKAKIHVYGGKFYEFNPALTYGEPGGPVSYVPEGYHVVESTEEGLKVYEVVKD